MDCKYVENTTQGWWWLKKWIHCENYFVLNRWSRPVLSDHSCRNNGKDCSVRLRKASSTSILHNSNPLPVIVVENGPPSLCRLMTEQVNFFYHWTLIRVIYCVLFCFLPSSQYEELLGVNGLAFICAPRNSPFGITRFLDSNLLSPDSNLFRFMKKMLMHDHVKSVPWQMTCCYDLLILSVCLSVCLSVSLSLSLLTKNKCFDD